MAWSRRSSAILNRVVDAEALRMTANHRFAWDKPTLKF
jgi:hypothetical protein